MKHLYIILLILPLIGFGQFDTISEYYPNGELRLEEFPNGEYILKNFYLENGELSHVIITKNNTLISFNIGGLYNYERVFRREFSHDGSLLREGDYDDENRKQGLWKYYHEEEGYLLSEVIFQNNEIIRSKMYYKSGGILEEFVISEPPIIRVFYETGYLKMIRTEDSERCWDENGNQIECKVLDHYNY
tara:strand:+ start:219 stop:785 length:567 start_codon:yes stop_codon:yes gene_type:complete